MFKTNAFNSALVRMSIVLFGVLASIALLFAFGTPQQARATVVYNNMTLAGTTDITGATVNYTAGTDTVDYTGNSQYPIVESIVVGTDTITVDDTNFDITYTRNGEATEDLASVGEIVATISGKAGSDYTGSVTANFTINQKILHASFTIDTNVHQIGTLLHYFNGADVLDDDGTPYNGVANVSLTYYNKTLGQATDGIYAAGTYVVSVHIDNQNCKLTGTTSTEIEVKDSKLTTVDNKVSVISNDGFDSDISLVANITSNESAIAARDDLKSMNVVSLMDVKLYKGNKQYNPAETVKVSINLGKYDYDNLKLLAKNTVTGEFSEVNYTVENGVITFSTKDVDTYVLAQKDQGVNVWEIVALCATVLVIISLLAVTVAIYVIRNKKKNK